jgi:hypothetical protein
VSASPSTLWQIAPLSMRRGVTYAQLAEKLAKIGVHETERNLNNKISRGGFSAAFLLQCMLAIGSKEIRLD